ncbi:MAG TPA: transglutaminase domain-containing protein [Myxococcota bacterium]|nr:transglutaminase domain-containing protein [Myxococcota bacterium]
MTRREGLEYFARPGPYTALPAADFAALPEALAELCSVVQGSVLHPFMPALYGLTPDKLPLGDLQERSASAIVARVRGRDPRPFGAPRPPDRRFCGNCRHHTVLLAALLRAKGVPVRARCGFAAYFQPGWFVDHWVAEVWTGGAWRLVDAQLDRAQRAAFRIGFDPLDVPRDAFLVAGEAWRRIREGSADPARFGVLDMFGSWFAAGNVVRDVAALAKQELLPWDVWGAMRRTDAELDDASLARLDRGAALAREPDAHLAELLELAGSPAFRVPERVFNAQTNREEAPLPR